MSDELPSLPPLPPLPPRLHLAVAGSVGGTTMALQYARETVLAGGRVIWAAEMMPDAGRFGQLFAEVDLIHSSRFHAMEIGTDMKRGIGSVIEASKFLPGVELVVIDDWAPGPGKTSESSISAIGSLLEIENIDEGNFKVVLISKSYESPTAVDSTKVRVHDRLEAMGCDTWLLSRFDERLDGRLLETPAGEVELGLGERGFS